MDLNLLYSSMSNLPVNAIIVIVSSHLFLGYFGFVVGYRYGHHQELRKKDKLSELTEALEKLEQKNSKLLKEKDEILKEKDEILKERNSFEFLLHQRDTIKPIRTSPW